MNQIQLFFGNLMRPLCRLFCLQDVCIASAMDFDDSIGLTEPNHQRESFKRKRGEHCEKEDGATNAVKKRRTTC